MTVSMFWNSTYEVPEYTVRVYTDQIIKIESATGEVGSYNYAMDRKNGTIATSAPEYVPVTTCVDKMIVSNEPNNTALVDELLNFD